MVVTLAEGRGYLEHGRRAGTGLRRGPGAARAVSVTDRGTEPEQLWRVTARDNVDARGPSALRRRFDALRATPLRAHSTPR